MDIRHAYACNSCEDVFAMKPEQTIVAAGFVMIGLALVYTLFHGPGYDGLPVSINALPAQGAMQSQHFITPDMKSGFVSADAQLYEGHWQGLEALHLTDELKKKLGLPMSLDGLLIDEVTLRSAVSGLLAGDVLVAVNGRAVVTLKDLVRESRKLKNRDNASLTVIRKGASMNFILRGDGPLGFAQVETAPMIRPGAIMPHPYRGECTRCHPIGATGHIVPDPGGVILPPPPIRAGAALAHRDRGPCAVCHLIIN